MIKKSARQVKILVAREEGASYQRAIILSRRPLATSFFLEDL
jgi:hypothetical protein